MTLSGTGAAEAEPRTTSGPGASTAAAGPRTSTDTGTGTSTSIRITRASTRRRRTETGPVWSSRALRLGSVVAAVLLWQLLTANDVRLWLRFDTLPTVTEIVSAFGRQLGTDVYYLDLGQSLIRILTGFAIATVLGVASGIALGRSRLFADVLGPLTELARPVPAIAVVPIAILLFPDDEAGIVFITSLAAYFPIMVSTRHAVRALPTLWEDSVRTLGGGRWDVLVRVVFPGALPGIFGGLSVGIGVAWICLISAEMISGRLGVGYRTWQAYTIVDYPGVFVGIITIGVLGFATSAAIELLGRRVTRWLPRGEENAR
ncbi:ABC transporter permease [Nocardia cyriacigeorgica]|uniref:ABC transporter permease n=1 Tax=Nocardia cyriacigeorgica TaxID=135487 RepID=UPI001894EAD7|nr:ABC transporter permease [Nocardia cyriacigeorgica]MBF6289769.1 ABC transporter permease [Nocardia cyriacigeorgica]